MKIPTQGHIIFIAWFMLITNLSGQTWTGKAPIPTPRWYPGSVVVGGKIYVIGGQDSTAPYQSLNTVEAYDPLQDSWEIKTPMPTDRWGLMVAAVNGKIYAIGGRRGSASGGHAATDVIEEYDPVSNTWTSKAPMPTARGYGGCGVYHDTIFVFGGRLSAAVAAVEKYHPPTDLWFTEPPMPTARYTFTTALVIDKFYLIGGWKDNLVQEYDLSTRNWTTKTSMPTPRGGSGVGVIDERIYVVGGRGGNGDEFECYSTYSDSWTTLVPMPTPREGLTAGVVNNKLYVITGSKPVSQDGFPYYGVNEEADRLTTIRGNGESSLPKKYSVLK